MKLWRLRTCLFLASLMLTMLTSLSKASSIDTGEIIDSLKKGKRTVLLLARLPKRAILIVSSIGSTVLNGDAVVFEQSPGTLTERTMQLTDTAKLYKDLWPKLPRTADAIGVFHDASEYLVLAISGRLQMYDFIKGQDIIQKLGDSLYASIFGKHAIFVSSLVAGQMTILMSAKVGPGQNTQTLLHGQLKDHKLTGGWTYACRSQPGHVSFNVKCQESKDFYSKWYFTAGYLTDSSVNLVDSAGLSIVVFSKDTLTSGSAATFKVIPFANFWVKPSSYILIIVICVVVALLLIGALVTYFLCKRLRTSKPENVEMQPLAPTGQMSKGAPKQSPAPLSLKKQASGQISKGAPKQSPGPLSLKKQASGQMSKGAPKQSPGPLSLKKQASAQSRAPSGKVASRPGSAR